MMRDDFDDFIDEIKKYFKIDSDIFDVDFLFLPESEIYRDKIFNDKNVKGFKISFHYETGMDKPEIKVEGNLDDKKLHNYLKNIDISKYPKLKELFNLVPKNEIDAGELSLEFNNRNKDIDFLEPYTEIIDTNDTLEIIFEIPGMDKDNVKISFNEEGNELIFNAENETHKYTKNISLSFNSSKKEVKLDVNNGIANIKLNKYK
ncbi:MAG: Hsp20/alpha crystallin family protein [Promethearchaeota archaeon]